jgi:hypothetical protein
MLWLIALAVTAVLAVRSRFWPWARCRACQGRKGRGAGSTDRAYNRCYWCGGSGERVRPLALIWPQHRAKARQLKEQRRSR